MLAESNQAISIPGRRKRNLVTEDFVPSSWEVIAPYYRNLLEKELNSLEELKKWLGDWSELDTIFSEYSRWVYVRTTVDTSDEKAKAELTNLYLHITPQLSARENLMKRKFVECPFIDQLDLGVFFPCIRRTKKEIELFREENIALLSEMNMLQSKYDEIPGRQSIVYNGSEITLHQAAIYLQSTDRAQREEVFRLVHARRMEDEAGLDELLTSLIQIRHRIALNAGYKNYIEYRFDELGRFDYTPADCLQFHQVIEEVVMPLVNRLFAERKSRLELESLKPWDLDVDVSGKDALNPFTSTAELIEKTIHCFKQLDPYFGERIEIMKQMNYLDLDSRMHKGPGGYNVSMPEIGVPFIFMNSANSAQDLVTIVHEGGHAIHTFLAHELEFNSFKEVTAEIAEVASMSMELMSMEHWDIFYNSPEDLKRAKKNHLEYILSILSRVCLGDSFQFWLYTHPGHTVAERKTKWRELSERFTPDTIDWNGFEANRDIGYQRILHFYIAPLYYIEYAFAQLGALAIWKNFKQAPAKCISNYKKALSLGYTKPIPVFYETAGAKFDFSRPYVASLVNFLDEELKKL